MSFDAAEIIAAGELAGIDAKLLLAQIAMLSDAKAKRQREAAAERQRRSRMSRNITPVTVTSVTDPSPLCPPFPSPHPNPNPPISPQPLPSSSCGRELERECRAIVGAQPVALAQDFAALAALQSEGVTAEDIVTGVRSAMACEGFRPLAWRQMIGWARRAGKDRLGASAKVVGIAPARASPPEKPKRYTMLDAMREMMAEADSA